MLGAIIGDIAGIPYEREPAKADLIVMEKADSFSDDTILTMAIADFCQKNELSEENLEKLALTLKDFTKRYPNEGYGSGFLAWVASDLLTGYDSWGNGSAMRVSYIGYTAKSIEECLEKAKLSALPTHNHEEGVKGAQAIALAIHLAKTESKETIKKEIEKRFDYDLDRKLEDIRPEYSFDVSCQGSVPEAIIAFLESTDFESALYNAITLGGDSDTQAAMAGGIAEAFYKEIPDWMAEKAFKIIPDEFKMILKDYPNMV